MVLSVLYFVSPLATFIFLSLLALSAQKENLSVDNDICRLFADGSIMRKPGTCTESIKCIDHRSEDNSVCTTAGQQWSLKDNKCASGVSDAYCKSPCVKASPTYVVDPKNCRGWYQCNGATTVKNGNCDSGLVFDQPTQYCVYPSQSNCQATYDFCDVAKYDMPFKDEVNCHKYFTCNAKGLQENTCDTGKYYDVDAGACIPKAQVDCYKHPYPTEVCGTTKLAIRNRFVSDGATCRGYYLCRDYGMNVPDKAPEWGECPDKLFFNEEEQACMARQMVKCNEDRCDGLGNGKTLSEKPGCRSYLVCENSITVDEVDCYGSYFDIENSACTNEIKAYAACRG